MRLTETNKNTTNLRLKSRNGDYQHRYQKTLVKVLKTEETQLLNYKVQNQNANYQYQYHAAKKTFAPSAFQEINNPIDNQADKEKLNPHYPPVIFGHPAQIISHWAQIINHCVH